MTSDTLRSTIDGALAARRPRPIAAVAGVLARAATRWRYDPRLDGLAASMRLSAPVLRAALDAAADAIQADALVALGSAGDGPALVACVLASNVPALALPAIVHALLVGAAVVVKSGRDDRVSAPAFRDAIAAEDETLAATVVPVYWPGGDTGYEAAAFAHADVVLGTGGPRAVAALRARARPRFVGYGERLSIGVVAAGTTIDVADLAARIARDTALVNQRGCLSLQAVFVDRRVVALDELASAVAAALDTIADVLPPGPVDAAERARVRAACDAAEWADGARVLRCRGGTVLCDPTAALRPPIGGRTLRLHPLDRLDVVPSLLPADRVEAVAYAGDPSPILAPLRDRGVSRVCPFGTLQSPPIAWPRGQLPPLATLRGDVVPATMLVEP